MIKYVINRNNVIECGEVSFCEADEFIRNIDGAEFVFNGRTNLIFEHGRCIGFGYMFKPRYDVNKEKRRKSWTQIFNDLEKLTEKK